MTVEEIYDNDADIVVSSSISGIYDEVTESYTFGTNTYPLIGEQVFKLWNNVLDHIFTPIEKINPSTIGTYVYGSNVLVGYNPNILFGKHLGVFGNTGSGKTCTVVSIIQNYIRNNKGKDIKFIILDVNGEYQRAFDEKEAEYISFDKLRLGSYYIDKLSREGRKFGVGLIVSSQIPSMLAYEVVSQCNTVIMHKITSKRDMEYLRGVLRVSNDTFYLQMSALEKQHAIVCGEAFPNDSIVKIHDARPLPKSNDPEIEDIFIETRLE